MLVHIQNNFMVSDVQERFSKCFPCLKIEFYDQSQTKGGLTESNAIAPGKRINEIRDNDTVGVLDIKSWDTVEKAERDFKEKFGLNIRIFRKEDSGWVPASDTRKYTLLQQAELVCDSYARKC